MHELYRIEVGKFKSMFAYPLEIAQAKARRFRYRKITNGCPASIIPAGRIHTDLEVWTPDIEYMGSYEMLQRVKHLESLKGNLNARHPETNRPKG